ncbi:MAG: amidophosphoribosyltransferase [Candidatus Thermoplasmatota archaeon]|nr:amidophosphoribosyltransferase [Candidatus Thermoplasmatota archaeon]
MKEECGVIGIASREPVSIPIFYALRAIQHRGQESAGISVFDSTVSSIRTHKGMGLVERAIRSDDLHELAGNIGIGHVRYSTAGGSKIENAQPLTVSTQFGEISLAHNGDIVNADKLRAEKKKSGWAFITETDSEVIIRIFADELSQTKDPIRAMSRTARQISGSYSLALLVGGRLFAVRDLYGIKPLCIGKFPESKGFIVASESVSLDLLGAELIRDVEPGEMVELKADGIAGTAISNAPCRAHCMFEYVYFARDDSVIDGRLVHDVRETIGKMLAKEHPVKADVIVPIPDSGRTYAAGYSAGSGIPMDEALIKNRYIWRTFIMPGQGQRDLNVRLKLNPIKQRIAGKRVVLVDDSVVRGTTMRRIVQLVRNAGAKEVHVRIGSPPVVSPCYLGIDMHSVDQFVANGRNLGEICKELGADSLGYLGHCNLIEAIGLGETLCMGCLNGKYPVPPPETTGQRNVEQKFG